LSEASAAELIKRGIASYRAGNIAEAAELYRAASAVDPANAEPHFHLGMLALQRQSFAEAASELAIAAENDPKDANILAALSEAQRRLRRLEDARKSAHRATVLEPSHAAGHVNLGLALLELNRLPDADRALARAQRYAPGHADVLAALAALRLCQNLLIEAEGFAGAAIRARPTDSRMYVLLGDIFSARGNKNGMIEAYRRARNTDITNAEALERYVAAEQEVGGLDAARQVLEDAVARMPDAPQSHIQLANFLSAHGMLDDAGASLHRALLLDPGSVPALRALSETKKFASPDDPDIALMRQAYDANAPETADRATLAFGLGKALDDTGQYLPAIDAYLEGNGIARRATPFSMDGEYRSFRETTLGFNPELMSRLRGGGHMSRAPIFVVGMPRSGTTLTETILSRHPDVRAAGELEFMDAASIKVAGADAFREARQFVHRIKARQLEEIGASYVSMLDGETRSATRFTDKLPNNFTILGLIRLVFPNAKIVHVRRNPLDNCLSLFKSKFSADGLVFSNDLTELGHYYNLYRDLMQHWRTVVPGEFFEIDYEHLVSDPGTATRALFAYCDLEWSPDVLSIENSRREVKTMSFAQVRQPIHQRSVDAAARYGDRLDPLRAALAAWTRP
jgi:tetratricopeptide (TPR) repeat protein